MKEKLVTKSDLGNVKIELRQEIAGVRQEMDNEIGALRQEINEKFAAVYREIHLLERRLVTRMNTMFIATIATLGSLMTVLKFI